jgi:uncharacterized protein (TIGR02996 family)
VEPPPFPRSEADLEAWAVYADWLQLRGDPRDQRRGELIVRELALPVAPSLEEVTAFQRASRRVCGDRRASPIAWCLGHARALRIRTRQVKMGRATGADHGTLASVRDLLASPVGRSLETLELPITPREPMAIWRRLMAVLPPSCVRVGLELHGPPSAEWNDAIPTTVRELRLLAGQSQWLLPFVGDRFDVVEIHDPPRHLVPDLLDHTTTMRLRVRRAIGLSPRVELGAPDDAVLAAPMLREAVSLARWNPFDLQWRYGRIPARAQLAAQLPEGHGISVHRSRLVSGAGSTLVRRGESWTFRFETRGPDMSMIPRAIFPIRDGDRLTLDGVECVFHRSRADWIHRSAKGRG